MQKKIATMLMLSMLLLSIFTIVYNIAPVAATPYGPSLVVDDATNRINATSGAKAGSKVTVSGTVTNVGATPLTGLLTAIYLRDDAHSFGPTHIQGEWSTDGYTFSPMAAAYAPGGAWDAVLILGPAGGYSLAPGGGSTTYVRITSSKDIGISSATQYQQTCAVSVFQDSNLNYKYDAGEPQYSQDFGPVPPVFDTPVKVDLAIFHTAELDPVPPHFFYNIQDAINAATGGETIYVYDGTYKEALHIMKSLTIKAASTPVIQGSALFNLHWLGFGNREAVIYVENTTNVVLEGLDIEGQGLGPDRNYGILYQNASGAVRNCIVSPNTVGDMYSVGIGAITKANLVVEGCLIHNYGRIAVYCTDSEIVINENEIFGQVYSGEAEVNYGIEIEDGDFRFFPTVTSGPSIATITKNKIHNCDNTHPTPFWSSAAIIVDIWKMFYDITSSTVSIEHNKIYDNYLAIEVVSSSTMHAHHNCIYDNLYGVYVDPDFFNNYKTFDARFNWWGDDTGPYHPTKNPLGLGQDVGDYVQFDPWLTSAGFDYHRKNPVVDEPVTFDASLFTAPCSALKTVVSYTWNFDDGNTTVTANPIITHKFAAIGDYDVLCTVTYDDATTITDWETVHVAKRPYFETEPALVEGGIIGSEFHVNVTMNDLDVNQKTVAVQFRLQYDDTLMEYVGSIEGPFMMAAGTETPPTYFIAIDEDDPTYGPNVMIGILVIPNETNGEWSSFASGSGLLATIVFSVTYRPIEPETASGDFGLAETLIVDEDIQEVPHSTICETIYEASPISFPTIKLEPEIVQIGLLNKTFQVNVTMNDLDVDLNPVAVEFRVCYDDSLMEVVGVTEGPFMQQAGRTFFIYYVEVDSTFGPNAVVGILVLPDNETGEWSTFPSGSGVLATIAFKSISQERGSEKPPLTSYITLNETMLLDVDLEDIPHSVVDKALFEMYPTHIGDFNYDGRVDMKDISRVAKGFGSFPGHSRWDPICDVNNDGVIDMKDISKVARGFGWRVIHDC